VRESLLVALIVISCGGCDRSPTNPSPPPSPSPSPSGPIHDTLNASGSAATIDAVWSERSGGSDRQVYDDFASPADAAIRILAWQGIRPTAYPPTGFYISFIADSGGFALRQPDDTNSGRPRALYATTYAIDQVNERLGVTQACDNSPQQQCGSYDYSVTLPSPFRVSAGTRYWLLIQAESPLNALSGWSWRKSQAGNRFSMSNIAGTTFPCDLAFALRP
jgi:hypothetical protein